MSGASSRRPKIVDVAKAAGVSPTTVSHALNGRGQVDPRTRERVLEAARQLNYRPHLGAQRLRTGSSRNIALVSSMPFSIAGGPSRLGFFMEIASSAAQTALTEGYAMVLVPPLEKLPSLDDLDIAGAIVVEPQQDDEATEQLRQRAVPVVTIGEQPCSAGDVPFVDMHAAYCSRILLDHLDEVGAREIALVTGAQRRAAYLSSQREYELFTRRLGMPHRLVLVDEAGGEEAARRQVADLLARAPDVDGICALVDTFATGAVRAVRDSGRSLPRDVRVVTRYDGLRARTSDPPLTAINLHLDDVATEAVRLLLRKMSGEEVSSSADISPPILVSRASSALVTAPGS